MNHRNHKELKAYAPERKGLPFLYHLDIVGQTLVTFDHRHSFGVCNYRTIRIFIPNHALECAVVRLHMIYYKIVNLPVPYLGLDVGKKLVPKRHSSCVDQGNFLILNQIGIIADAKRKRPLPLEEFGLAVVHANKTDSFR